LLSLRRIRACRCGCRRRGDGKRVRSVENEIAFQVGVYPQCFLPARIAFDALTDIVEKDFGGHARKAQVFEKVLDEEALSVAGRRG
jgi:hypothetical protein